MAGNGGGERKGKEFFFFCVSVFWLAKDVGLNFYFIFLVRVLS